MRTLFFTPKKNVVCTEAAIYLYFGGISFVQVVC